MFPRGARVLSVVALAACGARTELRAPSRDAGALADVPGGTVCTAQDAVLAARSAELLLLIDRSSSMAESPSGGAAPPSKWDAVRAVMTDLLPRVDRGLAVGLELFPGVAMSGICAVDGPPDVLPARGAGAEIVRRLDATGPDGRTPTWGALQAAERYFTGHASPGFRAVVLATDGGPNCNSALDGQHCACAALDHAGQQACVDDPALCLDDRRTVDTVRELAARSIPTFVIGFDASGDAQLADVLARLAAAGGRARPGSAHGFYDVRGNGDLQSAVDGITREVGRCLFAAPPGVGGGAQLAVFLGSAAIAQDPSHADGWDFADAARGTVAIFGASCERVSASAEPLRLTVSCPGGG